MMRQSGLKAKCMRNKELKLAKMKGLLDSGTKKERKRVWMKLHMHGRGKAKVPQKFCEWSLKKLKSPEKMEEDDVVKEPGAKRKKSIPRKSTRKRQKLEEDAEKDELKGFLDIVPREEVPIEVESISTKFPIVDWKTYVLTETFIRTIQISISNRVWPASGPEESRLQTEVIQIKRAIAGGTVTYQGGVQRKSQKDKEKAIMLEDRAKKKSTERPFEP
ncbi:hypothetical protein Tco_0111751 [Tanacetum coccineum]